jgi:hypothetical protein
VSLADLHGRLDEHFRALRATRDLDDAALPIFALEHGLGASDLVLLHAEICAAVRQGWLPSNAWLPFVVYAAEVGYDYSGEEYWPTFEARTPRWQQGNRHYIRDQFKRFRDTFRGAEPTGPWAKQFSIICWPITHAVLPTDLQRQLARLLSDYSRALTSGLLEDPAELGRRLAARAWQSSSRFQNFAQNTDLLGQVAAALLVGDDDESPFLLKSTLMRIVSDLSEEREARRWLGNAKATAWTIRTRGLGQSETRRERNRDRTTRERLPSLTDPDLTLRRDAAGWSGYLELPDLSALGERLPGVRGELSRLRPIVSGVDDPLARGRLLYAGQRVRLDSWPSRGTPLISLEAGSSEANALLADLCRISDGPTWLFRLQDAGTATEVRGKRIHPGRSYVLLSSDPLTSQHATWIEASELATSGAHAYSVRVPEVIDVEDVETLRGLGLGATAQVAVRPVGLVPALWDGEGLAEWNVGEDPLISVSSTQKVERCIFTFDGMPFIVPWPDGEGEVFVQIDGASIGTHTLHVALTSADSEIPVVEGALQLLMRTPAARGTSGTPREGFLMLANPVTPSLNELWDGKAVIEIRGPADAEASVHITLSDKRGHVLGEGRTAARLPVDSNRWLRLFSQMRDVAPIRRTYDDAESCVVAVANPRLGAVSLRCERDFVPLRWTFGSDGEGSYVRLIDSTDGAGTVVSLYNFATPDRRTDVVLDDGMRGRWPTGGLVSAVAGTNRAAAILPPHVHDLDDLRATNVKPRLNRGRRSVDGVHKLIELAERWEAASLPANAIASLRKTDVLRAISGRIAGDIGGDRWERLEQRVLERATITIRDFIYAVGEEPYQRRLALDLSSRLDRLGALRPERRTSTFAYALAEHARPARVWPNDTRFAEFVLRLSSATASLAPWPTPEIEENIARVLTSPVIVRAARFLVLAIEEVEGDVAGATYSGWIWQ